MSDSRFNKCHKSMKETLRKRRGWSRGDFEDLGIKDWAYWCGVAHRWSGSPCVHMKQKIGQTNARE